MSAARGRAARTRVATERASSDRHRRKPKAKAAHVSVDARDPTPTSPLFPIVGIGASAGGRRSQIALIVTDLEMPEMSGWEVFRKIRELKPDARAVLVSGYLDPPMRASMIEGGAKGFLRKPYTLDEMLRVMRDVLDEERGERRASGEGFPSPGGANPLHEKDADEGGDVEAQSPSPRERNPAKRSRNREPERSDGGAKT